MSARAMPVQEEMLVRIPCALFLFTFYGILGYGTEMEARGGAVQTPLAV